MSTTISFRSFSESNLRERTELTADYLTGTSLAVASTQGFEVGTVFYVGELGQEGCERAVVSAVESETALTLAEALKRPHRARETVTAVLGDRIRIYRAPAVGDEEPDLTAFTVYATRSIDPDQADTYYTDSSGGAAYWYRSTYFNEATQEETELDEFPAWRGSDYAHYAPLSAIRSEAGFDNAHHLTNHFIDQQRRAAEAEINTALGSHYTVPFKPVPQLIRSLTIKLAAGLLLNAAYGARAGDTLVKDARAHLESIRSGDVEVDGVDNGPGSGVSSWPNDEAPRFFRMEDRF